ncbi:MAG: hypothetical protein U0807_14515 [Candidatus Binatia bacterium]
MARTVRVITVVAVLLVAATVRAAGGPCDEDRTALGVALANRAGVLVLETVDAGSPAAASGLRADDQVLQANATVPRACIDFAKAVREARRERKALLLLVARAGTHLPLVLGAEVWTPAAPPESTGGAAAAPAGRGAPTAPAPVPPPPPLPADVPVSVGEVLDGLAALAPANQTPTNLRAYGDDLKRLRRVLETLVVRRAAPAETTLGLRGVLRYYAAAEVAWKAIESQRDRDRRPARFPVTEEMRAEYFQDSAPATVIEEFPFLAETVVREPSFGLVESNGLWLPVRARTLLWEKGREALAQLKQGQQAK